MEATIILIITIVLVTISGIAKAIKDTLQFHFSNSIFRKLSEQWWNPDVSYANKYSNVVTLTPKFWGSTTILVALTDAWHLFQHIEGFSFVAGISLYVWENSYPIIRASTPIVCYIIKHVVFEICFRYMFPLKTSI